jgi:hypothetical protein
MHAIVRGRSPLRTVLYLADEWVLFLACLLACVRPSWQDDVPYLEPFVLG